ncbi:MAG: hypothetical protein Q4P32_06965 [Micrococcales bacterium]|nr:hypothetical protein [Micrococcales bacterium]
MPIAFVTSLTAVLSAPLLAVGLGMPALAAAPALRTPTASVARATAAQPSAAQPAAGRSGAAAKRYLGTSASRLPWHSGAWVGGWMNAKRASAWGPWRGTPSDSTLTFPEWNTWTQLQNSTWHIDTFRGFKGRLVYGLPLLPRNAKPSQLTAVAAGKHDATFRKVAKDLRSRGRGTSVVRIGWEANGTWMPFSVTSATAKNYRNAYRRVAQVMKKEAPGLVFAFDINCGTQLRGQTNRLDSLTKLYPGNDVVQLIGCSAYDWDVIGANSEASWRRSISPAKAVGVADVAKFARAKGKGLSFSEWGLAPKNRDGHGDNPFYIRKMKQFFDANADILVMENYFNEPGKTMLSSLWTEAPQNPKSAALYRQLW